MGSECTNCPKHCTGEMERAIASLQGGFANLRKDNEALAEKAVRLEKKVARVGVLEGEVETLRGEVAELRPLRGEVAELKAAIAHKDAHRKLRELAAKTVDTIKTGMDFPGMVAALVKARCIPSKDAKKTGLRGLARAVANPPKPCSPGDPSVVAAAASLDAVRDASGVDRARGDIIEVMGALKFKLNEEYHGECFDKTKAGFDKTVADLDQGKVPLTSEMAQGIWRVAKHYGVVDTGTVAGGGGTAGATDGGSGPEDGGGGGSGLGSGGGGSGSGGGGWETAGPRKRARRSGR